MIRKNVYIISALLLTNCEGTRVFFLFIKQFTPLLCVFKFGINDTITCRCANIEL